MPATYSSVGEGVLARDEERRQGSGGILRDDDSVSSEHKRLTERAHLPNKLRSEIGTFDEVDLLDVDLVIVAESSDSEPGGRWPDGTAEDVESLFVGANHWRRCI